MTACLDQREIDVLEPATGKPLGTVLSATESDILSTVHRAREAQVHWSRLSSDARAQYLLGWKQLIVQEGKQLAQALARENGKPYHEALLHEVVTLAEFLDFIAKTAPSLQEAQSSTPRWFKHRLHYLRLRPRGVVAVVAPFNFPLLIAGADSAAALAMGCAVVLKPSPACPLIVEHLVRLAHRAGIPDAVLSVLHGGHEVGQQLIQSGIDEVVFTGSMQNGRAVAQLCASRLTPNTLELGGNCPLLVLDDADVGRSAKAIVLGALTNSGQSCFAVGRVLVPRRLTSALQEQVITLIRSLRQGDPLSRESDLGALTTAVQLERCRRHVEQAKCMGARAIEGTSCASPAGNYFPPTVLVDARPDCDAYQCETFGPVIPIVAYDSLEQALDVLSKDPFGLAAYLFGSDLARAERVALGMNYAHVIVDQVLITYVCPELPLAGMRASGWGVAHGVQGLLAHTTPTVIGMPRLRLPDTIEFGWLDPKRSLALADGYLGSETAWQRIRSWTKS